MDCQRRHVSLAVRFNGSQRDRLSNIPYANIATKPTRDQLSVPVPLQVDTCHPSPMLIPSLYQPWSTCVSLAVFPLDLVLRSISL